MSRTIGGLLAVLIGLLMQWIRAPVAEEEIGPVVEQVLEVGGLLVSVAGTFLAWRESVQNLRFGL